MTDFVEAADLVSDGLNTLQTTGLPIAWGDDDFDPALSGLNGWLYVEIQEVKNEQITIGDVGQRTFRSYAEMHVWCYVPRGSGVGICRDYAKQIRDLFSSDPITGVEITDRTIGKGAVDGYGHVAPGRWYGIPVIISFRCDSTE
jgi:hypothetical protein